MGIGVFFDDEGLTFICDPFDHLDCDADQFEFDMAWEDFIFNLCDALPGNWDSEIARDNRDHTSAGVEYAFSGLHSLYVKQCESGNGNVYVTIRARETIKNDYFNGYANTLNLAIANLHKVANKIARCAAENVGPLRRRSGGWTTSQFYDFEPVTFSASAL